MDRRDELSLYKRMTLARGVTIDKLKAERDAALADVARLREALTRIADDGATDSADEFEYIERMRDIARAALGRTAAGVTGCQRKRRTRRL